MGWVAWIIMGIVALVLLNTVVRWFVLAIIVPLWFGFSDMAFSIGNVAMVVLGLVVLAGIMAWVHDWS